MKANTALSRGSRPGHKTTLIAAIFAAAIGATLALSQHTGLAWAKQDGPATLHQADRSNLPGSFADLVETIKPAVVNISISGTSRQNFSMPDFNFPDDSEMGDFFRRFFERSIPKGQEEHSVPMQSLGSGFIVDPAGYVVTNNHVVENADEIKVILDNGEKLAAELIGQDKKTDLALLKVQAKDSLPYVQFGDSDASRIGDWVIAIGNPFGLGGSTTTGIISARGRDINAGPLDDFIQVDAPINRGNSGGPLFNTQGQVIGVNTAIYSPNGGSVGIGFAIPANQAQRVISQIKDKGFVERGWLGVYIQSVSEEIAESLGMKDDIGALVTKVIPDSPATAGGLEAGDVILRYNGQEVSRMRTLPHLVANTPAGSMVDLEVWRNGHINQLKTVIATSDEKQIAQTGTKPEAESGRLGLTLADLNDEMRQQYNIEASINGVMITAVEPDSPAAKKGLRRGDVIRKVGGSKIQTATQVVEAINQIRENGSKAVLLLVHRESNDQFVALRFG